MAGTRNARATELAELRFSASRLMGGVETERFTVDVRSWHQAGIVAARLNARFSNRPLGVKHFQTFHCCGFYVSRGLALLFGIGT